MLGTYGQRAIVIGGSIAGMIAARTLADFFDEVMIFEADDAVDTKVARKRVPQGKHSHVLLQSGQDALERLFPGLTDEMIQNGSVVTDFINDLEWFHFGKWKQRFPSQLRGLQQTRPFLEWHIRERLKHHSNIVFKSNTQVVELLFSADRMTIEGIQFRSGSEPTTDRYMCNFLVDASGSGSQSFKWLTMTPSEKYLETVKINLFYATRFYRLDSEKLDWKNLMISAQLPDQPYGGLIMSFEDNQFGVTLGGYLEQPPKTPAEFERIANLLPQPHIYDFLQRAEPISDLNTYFIPSQTRKRFDRLKNLPSRMIVLGDAYCRFDPIYGQGMSVAALEAELLSRELRSVRSEQDLNLLHQQFYKKVLKVTKEPWNMATVESFRHPQITGTKPVGIKFMQGFTEKIYRASADQNDVYLTLAQVMNLVKPSSAFFQPKILRKLF